MYVDTVIFDMDGVIVDSEAAHYAAFQKTVEKYGRHLSEEEYKSFFAGRTDRDGFLAYFKNESAIDFEKLMHEKEEIYLTQHVQVFRAYPHVVRCIKEIQARQIPLGLVTGSTYQETVATLSALNIFHTFRVIITAEDVVKGKPDPEGYIKALRQLGGNEKTCVVIEDSPKGIRAARAAGLQCIALTHTHAREALSEANNIVDHLQLSDIFQKDDLL